MSFTSVRTRVGKYELGRTLGEGTFAKVKFAKNLETGESVAIKVLDKEKILKHKMVEQVLIFLCQNFKRIFRLMLSVFRSPLPISPRKCSCNKFLSSQFSGMQTRQLGQGCETLNCNIMPFLLQNLLQMCVASKTDFSL